MRRPGRDQARPGRMLLPVALGLCLLAAAILLLQAFGGRAGTDGRATLAETGPVETGPEGAPSEETVTIVAVGDTVLGTPSSGLPPRGGAGFFASVASRLAGDVVLVNLEGTFGSGGADRCPPLEPGEEQTCFSFQTPSSYARVLARAGVTVANTANNHAFDYGAGGQQQTIAALDAAGIRHTGRPGEIAVQRVRGISVAVVGFSTYGWTSSMNDLAGVRALIERADRAADVVVATVHAGGEGDDYRHLADGVETYLGENRGDVRAFAQAAVEAGADLVVGHGPHVLRAIGAIDGRLVAYSLGNFAGYRVFNLSGAKSVSAILRVTLRRDGSLVSARLVATKLDRDGVPRLDPSGRARRFVRDLSRADLGEAAVGVAANGDLLLP